MMVYSKYLGYNVKMFIAFLFVNQAVSQSLRKNRKRKEINKDNLIIIIFLVRKYI